MEYILNEPDYFFDTSTISDISGLPVSKKFPLSNVHNYLFLANAYYMMQDFKKTIYYLEKYISFLQMDKNNKKNNDYIITYFRCCKDLVSMKAYGRNDIQLLTQFYGKEITERVRKDLEDPKKAFIHYPLLECYRCDSCKYKKECNYQEVRNLYLAIKKRMSTAHMNQERIGSFFVNLLHEAKRL